MLETDNFLLDIHISQKHNQIEISGLSIADIYGCSVLFSKHSFPLYLSTNTKKIKV